MGVVGKVLFTKWEKASYGRELNWLGRKIQKALTRSTAQPGRVEGVAAIRESDYAWRVGIKFVRVAEKGSSFIFKGCSAIVDETFELSETVLTIGQALALREELKIDGRENELLSLFAEHNFSFDDIVIRSRALVAKNVDPAEVDNCPLECPTGIQAEGLARLLGVQLPSEMQWERAASGTGGLQRPWDICSIKTTLDKTKAVYRDSGTRPVKLIPATQGIFGLIGNVFEWTQEKGLRGGSCYSPPECACVSFRLEGPTCRNAGVRLARTI